MLISSLKSDFQFNLFVNMYLIIYINKIQFSKLFSLLKTIKRLAKQKKRLTISETQVIKILIIDVQPQTFIGLKNTEYQRINKELK